MGKRIIIHTIGSLGDIHPYLAIAIALKAKGHQPVIATNELYRSKIEIEGIEFASVRPHIEGETEGGKQILKQAMDLKHGTEFVIREMLLPPLKDTYNDLLAILPGADLFLSHPLSFVAPLLVAKTGIPWVSTILSSLSLLSAYDPPILPSISSLPLLSRINPWLVKVLFAQSIKPMIAWGEPVNQFRAEIGLPPTRNPLFSDTLAPGLILGLFSAIFSPPQPDWPQQVKLTGFPFFDRTGYSRHSPQEIAPDIAKFIEGGEPPLIFTLGSAAVSNAEDFYIESALAAKCLGERAILLIGGEMNQLPSELLSPDLIAVEYAPFSEIFPYARAIIHQGGIGTTAQALRAGKPMLVVPYSHDQPDNAARVVRLGVARTLSRPRYNGTRAANELKKLLQAQYSIRATEVSQEINAENGIENACAALLAYLSK
jgi:rhamnosyltransferase subunit B